MGEIKMDTSDNKIVNENTKLISKLMVIQFTEGCCILATDIPIQEEEYSYSGNRKNNLFVKFI